MKPKIECSLVLKIDAEPYIYFGLIIYILKGYKWVAMDETGDIYAYTHKPYKDSRHFFASKGENQSVGFVTYIGEWRQSRLKVKHLEKVRT